MEAGSHPAAGENEAVESYGDTTSPQSAPAPSQAALAFIDLVRGAGSRHLWGLLGWQDIRRRYRRSLLGPFWLTISMGVLVGALGTLYGTLLKVEVAEYIPFLAAGFVVWTFIQGVVTDGCTAFINAESIIKQVGLPLSVHVFRVVWRNLLIFFHNAAIFVVVAAIFSVWPGWTGLLALPGLILLCLNVIWAGLLLGIVSARFRDVPPIVASIVRILFFVTPIIWMPELMPGRAFVLDFNPFYHLVELVRAPLLGQAPGLASWLAVSGFVLGGWLVTFELFRRYRRRIAYWV
jgi:ABC-type polysaccharide/polyol phosphate export permease